MNGNSQTPQNSLKTMDIKIRRRVEGLSYDF